MQYNKEHQLINERKLFVCEMKNMAHKKKSLQIWCQENHREELLEEWDTDKNGRKIFSVNPENVSYDEPRSVYWKCRAGHEWEGLIVARTLFGRKCPICDPRMQVLPVGTKYGCLTIIGDYSIYKKEVADKEIVALEKKKESFLRGERNPNSNVQSVEFYDRRIEDYKTGKYYQCKCRCGLVQYMSEFHFLEKKHRYCTERNNLIWQTADHATIAECGLKREQREKRLASYPRVYDKNYNIDFTHTFHESLEVLECVNDHYEKLTSYHDRRKKGGGTYTVYKVYRCKCYLCGKEQEIDCSQFYIKPPTEYGYNAYNGYYSGAYCDCHKISSFQWIVNKILKENNIPYRVEVSFPDLYGMGNTYLLRYDFSVLNQDGTIKCLIECQGEQHYKPVVAFGGERQFEIQKKNDELKRKYATEHGILLLEIPYKNKKYEKVERFLRDNNVI